MAREIITHFHYIHHSGDSQRGFTLLELVFTVVIMGIVITMAAPRFNGLIESNKAKRLATEIEWLLVQAKSEAVMRGVKVYVESSAPTSLLTRSIAPWTISAKLESEPTVLSSIESSSFSGVVITNTSNLNRFYFDPIYGRPSANGSYSYSSGDHKLKTTLYTITGRIYTCLESDSEKLSSYEKC
ncbi:type IV pilin [Photobacterium kishitanii]|uniref:GspH/FimT family pseudopilin n=1 Tax=Photobacterium kishitanii TaxID=318456 RepID=UPI000D163EAB|nr:GspH/FimT family pseudopilin [Photobacterium kishitanii]PSW61390.1 type IV pilin [Photobacterium kishitanii]